MARVRPLSELDDVIGQLGVAAGRAAGDVVGPMVRAVRIEVIRHGARYTLRGANGEPVTLSATGRVQGNGSRRVGFVRGNPPGFWRIVEEGSQRHLIAGRYRAQRGIGPRLRQGGYRSKRRKFISSDGELTGFSPVAMPGITRPGREGKKAYSQFVVHPGHRSIGRPWRRAMDRAPDIAAREMFHTAGAVMGKAWMGTARQVTIRR